MLKSTHNSFGAPAARLRRREPARITCCPGCPCPPDRSPRQGPSRSGRGRSPLIPIPTDRVPLLYEWISDRCTGKKKPPFELSQANFLDGYRDCPGIPIDRNTLSTAQALGCRASSQYSRNMILASYNGTMAERTAHIGHDSGGQGKERRPGGRCDSCYQDIALSHLIKLAGPQDYSRRAGDMTRAGRDSFQHVALGLVDTGRHHTAEVYA